MRLKEELGLRVEFMNPEHEALLGIYYTGDILRKRARAFFSGHGITDVQFNLMSLLHNQAEEDEGLTQADLSRMMLVNRSNITSLIDRMEKANLVRRTSVPGDRRYNSVRLTPQGKKILLAVEKDYMKEVGRIMGALDGKELRGLTGMLDRIRGKI